MFRSFIDKTVVVEIKEKKFLVFFDINLSFLLVVFLISIQFPGCLQACQFFQNADLPQKDPVMPTSAEPSVQLVGNLATWPRPSDRSSNSKREKERLVYAVIQKQSSGRWRQIIQVRIAYSLPITRHAIIFFSFFFIIIRTKKEIHGNQKFDAAALVLPPLLLFVSPS
jgi:hypothetical protein